jgi:phospholipid N-methyltransferase
MQTIADKIRFFYSFLRSPRKIGSVVPSSSFLVQEMISPIQWEKIEVLVELGAGTGVITDEIAKHLPAGKLALIFEQDDQMREVLQRRFPQFEIRKNAVELSADLQVLGATQVDCILSSLPFANFSYELRESILQSVWQTLKQGGLFIAYQYSFQMHKMLKKTFSSVCYSFVLLNLPPAVVYICRK